MSDSQIVSMQSTLKHVESKINELGRGPHTPSQAEEVKRLLASKSTIKAKLSSIIRNPQQKVMLTQYPTNKVITPHINRPQQQLIINRTTTGISNPVRVQLGNPPLNNFTPPSNKLISKKRLEDLVKEIDPNLQLEEELEEQLIKVMEDFVDEAVSSGCSLAQHRKSNTLEVKDLKLHLERQHNIYVPGFGGDDSKQKQKFQSTEAHKQRMALIRKANKK